MNPNMGCFTLAVVVALLLGTVLLVPALAQTPMPAGSTAPPVPATYVGKPFNGKPVEVPATIKAWQYDISPGAKMDVTFHYSSVGKDSIRDDSIRCTGFGGNHKTTDNKQEDPNQVYLGWIQPGEWMRYSLHVTDAGTYVIGGHFAAGEATGAILNFSFTNGKVMTKDLTLPTTTGYIPGYETYHVWERLTNMAEVDLPAGDTIMTVYVVSWGGMNIESYTLTKKGATTPPVTTPPVTTPPVTTPPVTTPPNTMPPAAGAMPDLVLTKLGFWNPTTPKAGDAVTFKATVMNQGTAATPDGTILGMRWLVDNPTPVIWSDNEKMALQPGKSVILLATGGTAGATWTATPGTHTVTAIIDDAQRIPESNEDNNTLTWTFTIQ